MVMVPPRLSDDGAWIERHSAMISEDLMAKRLIEVGAGADA